MRNLSTLFTPQRPTILSMMRSVVATPVTRTDFFSGCPRRFSTKGSCYIPVPIINFNSCSEFFRCFRYFDWDVEFHAGAGIPSIFSSNIFRRSGHKSFHSQTHRVYVMPLDKSRLSSSRCWDDINTFLLGAKYFWTADFLKILCVAWPTQCSKAKMLVEFHLIFRSSQSLRRIFQTHWSIVSIQYTGRIYKDWTSKAEEICFLLYYRSSWSLCSVNDADTDTSDHKAECRFNKIHILYKNKICSTSLYYSRDVLKIFDKKSASLKFYRHEIGKKKSWPK